MGSINKQRILEPVFIKINPRYCYLYVDILSKVWLFAADIKQTDYDYDEDIFLQVYLYIESDRDDLLYYSYRNYKLTKLWQGQIMWPKGKGLTIGEIKNRAMASFDHCKIYENKTIFP